MNDVEITPERIRFLRKRLGLSQKQLGTLLNVHQTLVSHWEQGLRTPDEYQQEQLRHLYRSAQSINEKQHDRFSSLMAAGLVAGALAFLIGIALLLTGSDPGREDQLET